jgi:hypothetical protein
MIIKRWTSGSVTQTFNTASGTPTLSVGNTANIKQGANITGSGIPAGTVVSAITSSTTLTMSANATATATGVSLTFAGGYVKDFPQTQAQLIRNNADTDNVFDSNDKIKISYLPNAVFDSLYYFSSVTSNTTLASLADAAILDASSIARAALGYYWVISTTAGATVTLTAAPISAVTVNGRSYRTFWTPAEGPALPSNPTTTSNLEAGDWVVISKITGSGTGGDPYFVYFATVNNTYELMAGADGTNAGAPGLVPGAAANQNLSYLRGDGTWATPPGTYSHPTGGANTTISAANGLVLSAITVNSLGHTTSVSSKTLSASDLPSNVIYSSTYNPGTGVIYSPVNGSLMAHTAFGIATISPGSNGQVLKIVSGYPTWDTDANTVYTAGNGISVSSNEFSVAAGVGLTQEASGLRMTQPFISSTTVPAASYQVVDNLWFDIN